MFWEIYSLPYCLFERCIPYQSYISNGFLVIEGARWPFWMNEHQRWMWPLHLHRGRDVSISIHIRNSSRSEKNDFFGEYDLTWTMDDGEFLTEWYFDTIHKSRRSVKARVNWATLRRWCKHYLLKLDTTTKAAGRSEWGRLVNFVTLLLSAAQATAAQAIVRRITHTRFRLIGPISRKTLDYFILSLQPTNSSCFSWEMNWLELSKENDRKRSQYHPVDSNV